MSLCTICIYKLSEIAKKWSKTRLIVDLALILMPFLCGIKKVVVHNYLNTPYECKAKSRKHRAVFKVKRRENTLQVRLNWSQQLEHKQVLKKVTEPGVRKGKSSLLASHTRCKCSMETSRNSVKVKPGIRIMEIDGTSDRTGSHCNWSRVRMSFKIRERETSYCWIRSPYRP